MRPGHDLTPKGAELDFWSAKPVFRREGPRHWSAFIALLLTNAIVVIVPSDLYRHSEPIAQSFPGIAFGGLLQIACASALAAEPLPWSGFLLTVNGAPAK